MTTSKPFAGGLPLAIDVRKLEDRYGIPAPGTFLPHQEIAAVIGVVYPSDRYRSVTDAWRLKLFTGGANVDTAVERGKGIKFLVAPERNEESRKDFQSCARKARKSAIRSHAIPDEELVGDEALRRSVTHLRMVTARMTNELAKATRELKPPASSEALPRRALTGQA